MKDDEKLLLGVYDCMFKGIMLDPNNEDYLKDLISCITGISVSELENMKIENSEYIINNKNDKNMRSDIIVSIGNKYINIELNKEYYDGVFDKSNAYFYRLSDNLYKRGKSYLESGKIIQINFNDFYYFENNQEIYKFVYKEDTTNEILKESEIKYHVNLAYIHDTCYNKSVKSLSKFERYCLLLMAETKEFARTIAGDDKIMKKVSKRLEELSNDEEIMGLYDAEVEAEKIRRTQIDGAKIKAMAEGRAEGKAEGIAEGKIEGAKEKELEIAKNMLKMGLDKNIILEATKLSNNEIEELIN